MTGAADVLRAAEVCADFLETAAAAEWDVVVPDLHMSVAAVVAHAAECCLWYAIDLAARGAELTTVDQRVRADGPNAELIDAVRSHARVVAAVVAASPDAARGFHPMGAADPSGFAAMACDELLIHTDDAARGLGLEFRPPAALAGSVLRRIFPWVHPGDDAWEQLRWANGRVALGDRERLSGWAWHCAPLDEWNGSVPTRSAPPAPP